MAYRFVVYIFMIIFSLLILYLILLNEYIISIFLSNEPEFLNKYLLIIYGFLIYVIVKII